MSVLHSNFTLCTVKHKMKISLSDNHFKALTAKIPTKLIDISMNDLSDDLFRKLSSNVDIPLNHQSICNLQNVIKTLTRISMQNVAMHICQSTLQMLRATTCTGSILIAVHNGDATDKASIFLNERSDLIGATDRCLALS